jgi:1-deoxy-D-xylulose-5-phosphate reductoisomerase
MPCALNAANEVAVIAFLAGRVGFLQMPEIVEYTMEKTEYIPSPGMGYLEMTNTKAREISTDYINKLSRQT